MAFILPLLFIILFTESIVVLLKTKFEKALPLTFFISAITLFISQLVFKTFYVGLVLLLISSLYFIFYFIKNKKKIKDYITPGLIGFIILYLFIFIYDFNRFFTRWDELSHWGKMVKEMLKLDSFYFASNSNLIVHKDYPPMMSILELFYTFLCTKYREVYLIRCIHLFEGSLILSFIKFDKDNKKEIAFKVIISLIIFYILTFLFDSAIVINSIYIDYPLSLLTAFILFNVFEIKKLDKFNYLNILLSLIFLLLSKQVSIAFYLMILFLFTINLFKKYDNKLKTKIISFILLLIIPVTIFGVWNYNVKSMNIKGQFELSDIKISSLKAIASSSSETSYQKETLVNYAKALFEKPILNSNINISYISFGIILLILFLLIKSKIKDKNLNYLELTLGIGYLGYIVMMLLLYVYSFGEVEGPALASFDRYMCSYLLICFYVLMILFINYKNINIKYYKNYILIILVLLLLIKPLSLIKLRPDLIILNNHKFDPYIASSELIDNNVNDMDKVFVIDQVEKDGAIFYINYFSNKVKVNLMDYVFDTSDTNNNAFYELYYDKVKEYDYFYTYSIDEKFIDNYSFLTNGKLEEKTLYKINNTNNRIYLERIDSIK